MKVCVPLVALAPILLLSGCGDAAPPVQAARAADKEQAPALTRGSQQRALPATTASPASGASSSVRKLFDEVKRLNAACVAAGGGVSGSPDCDLAVEKEKQLESSGYCIDYPNDEQLIACGARQIDGSSLAEVAEIDASASAF